MSRKGEIVSGENAGAASAPTRSSRSAGSISQLFSTAVNHHQLGQLAEAESLYRRVLAIDSNHAASLHYLGVVALQLGRMDAAADLIGKAIALDDRDPQSHYHFGLALAALGRLDETAAHNRRAIALKPDYAEAHMNLGNALKALGRIEEAAACYERTIALRPNVPEAHYNLANVRADCGEFDKAIGSYRRALAIRPQYAEAHHNLGTALMAQGKSGEAAAQFRAALAINPSFVEALGSIAVAHMIEGNAVEALRVLCGALAITPTEGIKELFVHCVRSFRGLPAIEGIHTFLLQAMMEPWGRPSELSRVGAYQVRHDVERLARAASAYPSGLSGDGAMELSVLGAVVRDPLFRFVLENGPVCDRDLESDLANIRRRLLDVAVSDDWTSEPAPEHLDFACILARQCFINEYVFECTDEEAGLVRALREKLDIALASEAPFPAFGVAVVGAYQPLQRLPAADRLLARSWPEPVSVLLSQQVREPSQEAALRATMLRLTDISDDVSLLVQRQYEENPYPRWVKPAPAIKPVTLDTHLRKQFPLTRFHERHRTSHLDILVAGCGTGRHSIETARQFVGARVLATDLSLSSLCYAKRKTLELGLGNIEYAQADILELSAIGRTFDLVEAVGVLHHLAEPAAGWKALLALLRPGGFMHLGFYSELARRDVAAAQAFVAERGYRQTADDIRRCRRELAAFDDGLLAEKMAEGNDWFSTSGCRDLLFHVQEHCMTLPQIKALLAEMGLVLLGFELDARTRSLYAKRFPADEAMTDLDCWNAFESEHPHTFLGMYQFWVQRPAQ